MAKSAACLIGGEPWKLIMEKETRVFPTKSSTFQTIIA